MAPFALDVRYGPRKFRIACRGPTTVARAKRAICRRTRVEAATLRTAERALDDAEVIESAATLVLVDSRSKLPPARAAQGCRGDVAQALQYYRVAYTLVFVRAAPDASATVVSRRLQGDLLRATPAADNWVRVDGGFMMLEKPGLGRLLEPLCADEFEAASAAADARVAATRRETEALVERSCAAALATAAPGADEGALRARIRADVLRRTAAAEMTRTHHLASRAIVGAPAGSATCTEADAFVASTRLVDGLLAKGYVVAEDVLDAETARAARQEAESCDERLKPTLQALTGTRSDRVGWFGAADLAANGCPTLARLARLQRGVAAAINSDGRWRETLTVPASSMLSCYGAGGRYRKHTDNSRGADGVCGNARALTCICYLNPDWAAEDGGALRIYDESGDSVEVVVPAAGRVVVFDSFLEHEVLEARRDRYALTFWVFAER